MVKFLTINTDSLNHPQGKYSNLSSKCQSPVFCNETSTAIDAHFLKDPSDVLDTMSHKSKTIFKAKSLAVK